MNKYFIAISKFLGVSKQGDGLLHFKGVYRGIYVTELKIVGVTKDLIKGEDYIFYLSELSLQQGVLLARAHKWRFLISDD